MKSVSRFWLFSALGLGVVILCAAWGLSHLHLKQHTRTVADRLQLLNELRKGAVEEYFSTAIAELSFWSTNPDILANQQTMNRLWMKSADKPGALRGIRALYADDNPFPVGQYRDLDDAGDGSDYSAEHQKINPMAKLFVTERGYYDFFLIGAGGDVFYSVEKEADYGTNLLRGQWRDTGLAQVFREAVEQQEHGNVVVSDMAPYGPSQDAPALFIARALKAPDGKLLGVIAFQLPTQQLLAIMNYTVGMGETGETYLVGQDHLMRSDSRFAQETSVLRQTVDSATVAQALAGHSGVAVVDDYRGVEVLSAYTSLAVGGSSWAVMAEIDREEISMNAAAERPNITGMLLFFYGLSLWSVWYWRGRDSADNSSEYAALDIGFDASDVGGNPG